jgi:hypothetical protein
LTAFIERRAGALLSAVVYVRNKKSIYVKSGYSIGVIVETIIPLPVSLSYSKPW